MNIKKSLNSRKTFGCSRTSFNVRDIRKTLEVGTLVASLLSGSCASPSRDSRISSAHEDLVRRTQETYTNASREDIIKYVEAKESWNLIAGKCYPDILYHARDERTTSQFLGATARLMGAHYNLDKRDIIKQSYIGDIDLVFQRKINHPNEEHK